MLDLAKKIKKITNSSSVIQLVDNPSSRKDYEVEKRYGSSEKLLKLIGKKPDTSLEEGLLKTYEHVLS